MWAWRISLLANSPPSMYIIWLVTRNSTLTLEDTGTFFCPQFLARIFEGRLHSNHCLFYPLVSCIIYLLCGQRTRGSCEQIAESMQSRRKFSRVYFCLEVCPTDQIPFLQSTAPFIFPVCALCLHSGFSPTLVLWAILLCLSSTPALQTTVASASYQLMHGGFLSLSGSYRLDNVFKRFPSPL